ncbi:MAG: IS200/IS605 family element transposase accessory protein TnpB [Thermotogaceae bacterium]|nr:IS200/IS605 family element transposase accessory protein TnpB [Thermotogaceae bacterium]
MYRNQKNQVRHLTKQEYVALKTLCRLSKNLYNATLYAIRQYYFTEKKYLRYESAYHALKDNENYKFLNTDIAQQTMKVVDRNFKSFFALISKAKQGDYKFSNIKLPHYLPKDGYFMLIIPRFTVKDGYFTVPMSNAFKKEFGTVNLPFPKNLDKKQVKEIRIIPKHNCKFFEIDFVYIQEQQTMQLNPNNALGIDLGLDNLATCVTNTGASFIVDGKKLKSINQWYNKENARLQSIKDKQGIKGLTNRQYRLLTKRNNRVNYYMNKTARIIVNYCIQNNIGNIVVGYNLDWKRNINIGSCNNQNFTQIPHGNLRVKMKSLCERYGINYVEQEESYTSQADFFANDTLPVYNADNPQEYNFRGKRISRGQYRTYQGTIINADCNGALNILRKSNLVDLRVLQARGCLNQPERIRVA